MAYYGAGLAPGYTAAMPIGGYGQLPYTSPYLAQPQQMQATPQTSQQMQNNNNNGIIWVQGEAGAKSYQVSAGQSVMLMDSETSSFYIKSTDSSGMPLPLRIFDYVERSAITNQTVPVKEEQKKVPDADYITREEFERRLSELTAVYEKANTRETGKADGGNGEQSIIQLA